MYGSISVADTSFHKWGGGGGGGADVKFSNKVLDVRFT